MVKREMVKHHTEKMVTHHTEKMVKHHTEKWSNTISHESTYTKGIDPLTRMCTVALYAKQVQSSLGKAFDSKQFGIK